MGKHHDHHDVNLSELPKWVLTPIRNCLQILDDENQFLHLTIRGLSSMQGFPQLLEAIQNYDDVVGNNDPDKFGRLELAKRDAAWIERESKSGFPLLHSHSVVAIWASLENLCDDLLTNWLENRPAAWEIDQIRKLRIPLAKFRELSESEHSRYVVLELRRSLGTELRTGPGRLVPLLDVFGLAPRMGDGLRRALVELGQIRNVIVHAGGRADKRLVENCPWLNYEIGSEIRIQHALWAWYRLASERFAERVLNQVLLAFGFEGCNCVGMDDVPLRPVSPRNEQM